MLEELMVTLTAVIFAEINHMNIVDNAGKGRNELNFNAVTWSLVD